MIKCLKCGASNAPGSGFCEKCGSTLEGIPQGNAANKGTLKIVLIVLGVVILACVLCGLGGWVKERFGLRENNTANIAPPAPAKTPEPFKPAVNIPEFAGKGPEDFEKALGKAAQVTPITKTPEEMPGEFRHYHLEGITDTLQVRFYKGKAVAFNLTVQKEKQTKTPEELAKMAGFDMTGKRGDDPSPHARKWSGEFGGVKFKEITAVKSNVDNYYTLSVKVEQ